MTKIELDDEEMQVLNFALGLATASAEHLKMPFFARRILALCNSVNRSNPNFVPYAEGGQDAR